MSKAIVFDLDGTLVDSAPDLMDAHNYVMKKFGYDQKNFLKKLILLSFLIILQVLIPLNIENQIQDI